MTHSLRTASAHTRPPRPALGPAAFRRRAVAAGVLLALGVVLLPGVRPAEPGAVRFNRDVRPLLSENCFTCHGPDKTTRKAKLRLDTREGLFEVRDGRATVKPGAPTESSLYQRLTTADVDDRMPPEKSGKTLTAAQIDLFRRWIEQGAEWEGHWAYVPPVRPPLPSPAGAEGTSPIDRFVRARLAREGIEPSPEADRRTLLRRLSYDLTGLPPKPAEVSEFEADRDPGAYERWVDRFLASPHYGERMAVYWLDLVRYADTDGFHADNYRSVWPYRDYVIRAFNENKPFDQFTVEQLAGDLLPNATLEQRVASTFNRLGRSTEEGGAQPKEYLAKYAAERVRAVGTVWLAGTTGCAECHDHKYDPYTLRDFYRLAAYFGDIKEQGVGVREGGLVPSPGQAAELERLDLRSAELNAQLTNLTPALIEARSRWVAQLEAARAAGHLGWQPIKPASLVSAGGATLTVLEDLSVLSSGENPTNDTYTVTLATDQRRLTGIRLEALTHESFEKQSLARGNGNFVLTGFEVEAASGGASAPVAIRTAIADFSQDGYAVTLALDGKPDTGWAVAGHEKPANHQAAFLLAEPLPGGPGTVLTVRLRHDSSHKHHNIGRFRLSLIGIDQPTLDPHGLPPEVFAALEAAGADRTAAQEEALSRHFLAVTPDLAPARAELASTRQAREALVKQIPTSLMTVSGEPRPTRVLARGNWMDETGEIVSPAPPEFLGDNAPGDRRATRLDLARWLVENDHPLTARAWVNRLWKRFYGVGLSKNLDDLGAQGEWPTHPELLDWLAVEFMDHGWDVKHLVRLLVTSQTYRQSSLAPPALRERDPFNRLYARQSRSRIEAEFVRDTALRISGLLVEAVGGPSVKPYQPAGYWDQLNFPKRTWQHDRGEALYRRGLYTLWCRTFLHPSLMTFDACPREESAAERVTSNTPLQALTLLNDPIYVEASRAFAERSLRQCAGDPGTRVEWMFREALARPPASGERAVLTRLYESEQARFVAEAEGARRFVAVGERPVPADLEVTELAAWTSVARTVLNLHETITRN